MSKNWMGKVGGFAVLLGLVGIGIYGFYADIAEPPLEPARTLIELQAHWSGGTYGGKMTMLLTWLILLVTLMSPFVMYALVRNALRRGEAEPGWPRVGEAKTSGKRALVFLAMSLFGALTAYAVFGDRDLFMPLGQLGGGVLGLGLVSLVAGPLALLDTLLPSRWISGAVRSAKPSLSSKGEPLGHYDIELEQGKFTLDEPRARLLVQGQSIALRVTRLFDRVLEIRRPD